MKQDFDFLHEHSLINYDEKEEKSQNYTYYNFFNFNLFTTNFRYLFFHFSIIMTKFIIINIVVNYCIKYYMVVISNFEEGIMVMKNIKIINLLFSVSY